MTELKKYYEGEQVRVIANINGHNFKIGGLIEIVSVNENDYEALGESVDGTEKRWFISDVELEKI